MAIDAEDSLSADTRGLAQLVLTWALAAPPLLFWLVGLVDRLDSSIAPALLDIGARALAWPLFLIGVFHWVFTASTVVSSVILTFRSAPDRRKVSGWMAAFLAVLASLYVRGHNQF